MVFEASEQIGVSHIATKADTETAESASGENEYHIGMRSMSSAIRMLQERLSVICQYIRAVETGSLPPDNGVLIELNRIVDLLESLNNEEQKEKYNIVSCYFCRTNLLNNSILSGFLLFSLSQFHRVARAGRESVSGYFSLQMRLQAIMTTSVGVYAQTIEGMMDFIRKNVVLIDRRGQQKLLRSMGGGGFPHRGPSGFFQGQGKGLRRDAPKPSSTRSKGLKLFSFGKADADTDWRNTGNPLGEQSKGDVYEP